MKSKIVGICGRIFLGALWILVSYAARAEPLNQLIKQDFYVDSWRSATLMLEFSNSAIDVEVIQLTDQAKLVLRNATMQNTLKPLKLPNNSSVAAVKSSLINDAMHFDFELLQPATVSHSLEGKVLKVSFINKSKGQGSRNNPEVNLNFQSIPLRQALQILAQQNQLNVVMSDSVQGELSINLQKVPWQQAIETILHIKQLDKQLQGNVMLIAPTQELIEARKLKQSEAELEQQSGTLVSRLLPLHYAKASDIARMLVSDNGVNMLSERGAVSVDERTNAILVRDIAANVMVLSELIEQLDVPVKQVQIEARIVTVDEGNLDELGVRWGVIGSQGEHSVAASIEGNLWQTGMYGDDNLAIEDFLNVSLGLANPNASSIAFQVAKLGSDMLLDLELSALQAEAKAEIISSPKIITTNKKAAYIEQGTEIPYLEAASSGATSVSFRKAVLSLEVIPQITPDNRLVLDLNVTQDRPGEVVKTGFGEAVAINTQRIGTQVLVNNGDTVVLGGIYQQSSLHNIDKVPALGDLPLLGALFRRTSDKKAKSELLIFVTPTVIED